MYVPPYFAAPSDKAIIEIIRDYNFATLVHADESGDIMMAHVPVYLARDVARAVDSEEPIVGSTIFLHLARANRLCGRLEKRPLASVALIGPSHYITPDWYETPGVVPTWNFAAVNLHCSVQSFTDPERLHALFDAMARHHEPRVKGGWNRQGAKQVMVDKLINGIIGFELTVESCEATVKMSQNKSAGDRTGVVRGLRRLGTAEATSVADMMDKIAGLTPASRP